MAPLTRRPNKRAYRAPIFGYSTATVSRTFRASASLRLAAIAAFAAIAVLAAARAFAQMTRRNFIEPLITEDTFTDDEAGLLPGWSRGADSRTFLLAAQVEKSLARNISVEVTGQWNQESPAGESRDHTGFDDLEVMPKYAFYVAAEHEFRLAAAIDSFFPVGNPRVENNTHYLAGPMLLWAKGMGDLPRTWWLRYLRPIEVQGDAGYLFKFSGSFGGQAFADVAFAYNLPFMAGEAGGATASRWVRWPLANLAPFTEINYLEFPGGRRGRTPPEVLLTPGLAYLSGPYQLSLGTEVALNHAASQNDKASVLGLLNVQLDPLFPAIGWKPF
ncbi:MAG TPA: hypothetical protein VNE82_07580 [Candidatus Binataceae bacterium]|nr:hypothetical protein [Candidatus Binataceae bacterium]